MPDESIFKYDFDNHMYTLVVTNLAEINTVIGTELPFSAGAGLAYQRVPILLHPTAIPQCDF